MKRKIVCILVLTTLLLSGCTQQNNQRPENSSPPEPAASESAVPSTSADAAQSSSQTQSTNVQNSGAETEMISETATSESENITVDDARQIALDQIPGATLQDIREFESDYDNGRLQYEGKIYYEQNEYEFVIDGLNGTILEWDVEPIYGGVS